MGSNKCKYTKAREALVNNQIERGCAYNNRNLITSALTYISKVEASPTKYIRDDVIKKILFNQSVILKMLQDMNDKKIEFLNEEAETLMCFRTE